MDVEYRYSATNNNGRIEQMKDWVTGEEVNYQYDSLQRLVSAATTGAEWGLSFAYDGFGNRTSQSVTKGAGPTSSLSFNGLTNRISTAGYGYDANGNLPTMPGVTGLAYDVENRLTTANGEQYSYGPVNKRVRLRKSNGDEFFYFYGTSDVPTSYLSGSREVFTAFPWVSEHLSPDFFRSMRAVLSI